MSMTIFVDILSHNFITKVIRMHASSVVCVDRACALESTANCPRISSCLTFPEIREELKVACEPSILKKHMILDFNVLI
jgi:hypothetical protein